MAGFLGLVVYDQLYLFVGVGWLDVSSYYLCDDPLIFFVGGRECRFVKNADVFFLLLFLLLAVPAVYDLLRQAADVLFR